MQIKERFNGNFGWIIGIIIQLLTIAAMWGALGQRVSGLERISEVSAKELAKISVIESNYTWLRESITEIKRDIKEIKRR